MRIFIYSIVMGLGLAGPAAKADVPLSWIREDASEDLSTLASGVARSAEDSGAGADFDRAFSGGDSVLNRSELSASTSRKGGLGWYLQSMKTELGVEASGKMGVVAAGGEAAVELIWMRTPQAVAKLAEKRRSKRGQVPAPATAEAEKPAETASLNLAMSPSEVADEIDAVVRAISRSRKIRRADRLKAKLLERVSAYRGLIEGLASQPESSSWRPYKFQLELFAKVEGDVSWVEVGAVARVRLEWNLEERPRAARLAAGDLPPTGTGALLALAQDLELLEGLASEERLFSLRAVKVGVGVAVEGDLVLAEGKGGVIGSVFLKKVGRPKGLTPAIATNPALDTVVLGHAVTSEGVTEEVTHVLRERFRAGLMRARGIAEYVSARATRHELAKEAKEARGKVRQFELGAIEIELEVTASGGVVLSTVSGIASMELFLVRKGTKF